MLLETNWTGGLFTVAPANVGTNLSEGAFGFFGACAVTELSVIVTPLKYFQFRIRVDNTSGVLSSGNQTQ
jgi:hypothetical protein